MTHANEYATRTLEVLSQAVSEALDRKQRLGFYAVVWRDGRAQCIGADAPPELQRHALESQRPSERVSESRADDRRLPDHKPRND